jgi:alpha-glucosidase
VAGRAWWRTAVFYEIYVRSFADADGDGTGDLAGIAGRLDHLTALGVDALWLTPFFPSPGVDQGYDVADYVGVDPQLGTLDQLDALLAAAHDRGLRVIVDFVPNHSSSGHRWFRNALADPTHRDRSRYVFRPGRGGGEAPPNNWRSVFGGPAWTRVPGSEDWYLHLFAREQPDLDWHRPLVREDMTDVLRFWLDRGVDGIRIDVAHGLFKDPQLRDEPEPVPGSEPHSFDRRRAIDQPQLHPLYRRWRGLADAYPGERVLVGEVDLSDPRRVADYVRPDELHLAFNFSLLWQPWEAGPLRAAIDRTRAALDAVGATPTWVLENHDVARLATRYGGGAPGRRRARAALLLLLALPGAVFLYAGQELGLEDAELDDAARRDPIFRRTGGAQLGRDGSRVPLPWTTGGPGFGFTQGVPWLPVPPDWGARSVAAQSADPGSELSLHRAAIATRRASRALQEGAMTWIPPAGPGVLQVRRRVDGPHGEELACVVNVDGAPVALPAGERLLVSAPLDADGRLPAATAAWVRVRGRDGDGHGDGAVHRDPG